MSVEPLLRKWEVKRLEKLSSAIQYGYTAKATTERIGPKLLRITDIQNDAVNWDAVPFCEISAREIDKYRLGKNDLLFARTGATVGKSYLIPGSIPESVFASYLIRVRLSEKVYPKYVAYFFRSGDYWRQITENQAGIGQPNVNGTKLAQIKIPVAPLNQQGLIVAEIEKQFSRLDEAVANIKRVKANLKRYKASVLKAAVEGKLTEDWRKQHPNVEPASKFLERILAERHEKWNGRVKYKEPGTLDTDDLPPLASSWKWVSLDQLFLNITDGDHQPPPQTDSGVPFLVIGNVRSGKLEFENTRFVSRQYAEEVDVFRKPTRGDILYTLVGSFGIALRVDTDQEFCIQRHIGVLRPHKLSPTSYLVHALNSAFVFNQAVNVATGTAQKTVPLAGLRKFSIPLAPLAEQQQIVAEVERRLSVIEELEAIVEANLTRADRLRQSILNQAFSGGFHT
ncbi:MAG: restriction endonuclease subunit S [Nitrospirota bacterium]